MSRMIIKLLTLLLLLIRSKAALRYGNRNGLIGGQFGAFGRAIGWMMLRHGRRSGFSFLLTPVNITRYFEFPFVLSCLPSAQHNLVCLDVSSPSLFSLYAAHHQLVSAIDMINPDKRDVADLQEIAALLNLSCVSIRPLPLDALIRSQKRYDCIWAISVIEHIAGSYNDTQAMRWMIELLKPGGRLILTLPVDRHFRNEYRQRDYYGTQVQQVDGRYFFQRIYDRVAIEDRLLTPIGKRPEIVRWFGEKAAGSYDRYLQRWMKEGIRQTVNDPREIVDQYREYASWEDMPGRGVCGLMLQN